MALEPTKLSRGLADELRSKTDADLIGILHDQWGKPEIVNPVQAELARRQTEAIREFNVASSRWSNRLFWLSVAVGILVFFQLLLMFRNQ
jgi:hypothetical protein